LGGLAPSQATRCAHDLFGCLFRPPSLAQAGHRPPLSQARWKREGRPFPASQTWLSSRMASPHLPWRSPSLQAPCSAPMAATCFSFRSLPLLSVSCWFEVSRISGCISMTGASWSIPAPVGRRWIPLRGAYCLWWLPGSCHREVH